LYGVQRLKASGVIIPTMIYFLQNQPNPEKMIDMLQQYETMIKIVVDIRRRILAGGGEMHSG